MVADADTNEVLSVSMIGANAAEVIHEAALALRLRARTDREWHQVISDGALRVLGGGARLREPNRDQYVTSRYWLAASMATAAAVVPLFTQI
jgi:hypothetical protein